ncbi:heavy metal-associated domain-containing protein, partial [Streptomyces sp. SID2563]|uniref:cation transporter n=1 Tax=Streptomyces sp. SID2563 TaxID=2690255 RepID=UPI002351423A
MHSASDTHSATEAGVPEAELSRADFTIGGMTCASCAARVEKKLNRMDGVTATVNYATEKARVSYDGAAVSVGDLVATVERTGYTAKPLPGAAARAPEPAAAITEAPEAPQAEQAPRPATAEAPHAPQAPQPTPRTP